MALTVLVFAPTRQFDFVNYDDFEFITENPHVTSGLTASNVNWAVANAYTATGGPLTWLSHMLDVELFGLDAGGHHTTSLCLHVCNSLLVFAVLWSLTAAVWRSACVAALFAVHPLHVESVAWVSERKDVLSAFFWLLTMWAYVRYARRPGAARYAAVALFFVAGLLSKPVVATLPFALLLLDVWPLERLRIDRWRCPHARRVILEKVPLMLLSAAAIWFAYAAQRRVEAVAPFEVLPLGVRLSNAVVSYVAYIRQTFWPVGLAAFYPYRLGVPVPLAVSCAIVLVGVSIGAVATVRRAPYFAVGWFWFLGTLVPMIGFVQLGGHAMADRFTYVPLIGLFIAIVWGIADFAACVLAPPPTVTAAALAAIAVCGFAAARQVTYWRNGIALWEHAVNVTVDNSRAHANLGVALAKTGEQDRAIREYAEAIRLEPRYAEAHNNLALALATRGRTSEAREHFAESIRLLPAYANAHTNLANLLDDQGEGAEAIAHYREAIRLEPDHVLARLNLAIALAKRGDFSEAIAQLETVLRLEPGNQDAKKVLDAIRAPTS
jgi:tetratricopeptide (TPR) repeat protein